MLFQRGLAIITAVLILGCAGSPASPPPKPSAQGAAPHSPLTTDKRIRLTVNEWQGTPHRLGGTGRDGIDCSGFVQRIYYDLFGKSIPRTTHHQVQQGEPVDQQHLKPGDLVFFRPPRKAGHVGIYLGQKEFAHASTSRGGLDEPYWRECYWTARRYLD